MFTQKTLIAALVLAAATASHAYASACSNPCTGSSATGADSTDRTNFNSDNSDLAFSNITFNNATGTYDATTTGLNATTAPSASLFGVSFVGCLSSQNACASNSPGVIVGNIASWDGGSDPNLQVNSTNFQTGAWDTITITLPANTFAFGVDLIDQNGHRANVAPGFLVHVDATPDKTAATAVALPGSVFFGFRSATPIGTVTIYPSWGDQQLALDNLELGQTAPTPEIATILLIGTGLVSLFYARKRRWLLAPQLA